MWGYFRPLLNFGFWFSVNTIPFTPWADRIILFLMSFLSVAGIGATVFAARAVMEKDRKRVWKRVASCLVWAGVTGLILYVFTWQRVPILGMRFFYLAWAGGFGFWAYRIARFAMKDLPALNRERAARAAYEKWLPKPKGR